MGKRFERYGVIMVYWMVEPGKYNILNEEKDKNKIDNVINNQTNLSLKRYDQARCRNERVSKIRKHIIEDEN